MAPTRSGTKADSLAPVVRDPPADHRCRPAPDPTQYRCKTLYPTQYRCKTPYGNRLTPYRDPQTGAPSGCRKESDAPYLGSDR